MDGIQVANLLQAIIVLRLFRRIVSFSVANKVSKNSDRILGKTGDLDD
jgi:hypothetical protein